jgi:hypothetical protein
MDAFLSREASQFLEALSLVADRSPVFGFLIGHKRDNRYFVEKILPAPQHASLSADLFFKLNEVLDGGIVGFFAQRTSLQRMRDVLSPYGFGKLYLEINPDSRKKASLRSFVIDYEKKFCLRPILLKTDRKEENR